MKTRIRATAVLGLLLLPACPLLGGALATATAEAALSPSAYRVSALCSAPSPGHAGCLGLRLVAKVPLSVLGARALFKAGGASGSPSPTTESKKPIKGSLSPSELLTAYNLSGTPPPASTQTIGIIDAYDDANAEADLEIYDKEFGLPACTEANGCFRKVNQEGGKAPLPSSTGEEAQSWAGEIATDVEIAHGVCESCHILLVEANSAEYSELEIAEETAVRLGATEISNSWGGSEPVADSPAFNHPGVVITASAGDNGYLNWAAEKEEEPGVDYPASSPHVVAVGGTRLILNKPGNTWKSETVWNDGGQNSKGEREGAGAGGGGCSALFTAQPWQQSVPDWSTVGCGEHRAVADVSADADPYTGVAVYDSTPFEGSTGWATIGGTSLASPLVASVFALAGGAGGVEYPARTLYENEVKAPGSLHDVESGSNGECLKPFDGKTGISGCTINEEAANCSPKAICIAGPGYDGPTGVGTPQGIAAFEPGGGEEGKKKTEEEKKAAEQKRKEKAEEEERRESISKEGGTGGAQSTTASGASSGGQSGGSSASANTGNTTIQLSGLTLTPNALVALNRTRPKVSLVAFAFTINVAVRVRVTLAKLVRSHGRAHWQTLRHSLTIAVRSGRNNRRLRGQGALTPGLYRLTLTPAHGTARWLVFQIG